MIYTEFHELTPLQKTCYNRRVISRGKLIAYAWSKINIGGKDACWEYTGALDANGYGSLSGHRVHRLIYESIHGAIPEGLMVLHRCDNPPCNNPAHLFIGTARDNWLDALAKGRAKSF